MDSPTGEKDGQQASSLHDDGSIGPTKPEAADETKGGFADYLVGEPRA